MSTDLEKLESYCSTKGICPEPCEWGNMWEIIAREKRIFSKWDPPLPLILGAWYVAPPIFKSLTFKRQLQWAFEHGIIEEVGDYLRQLKEDEWFRL
jgi:hypothetical protein